MAVAAMKGIEDRKRFGRSLKNGPHGVAADQMGKGASPSGGDPLPESRPWKQCYDWMQAILTSACAGELETIDRNPAAGNRSYTRRPNGG